STVVGLVGREKGGVLDQVTFQAADPLRVVRRKAWNMNSVADEDLVDVAEIEGVGDPDPHVVFLAKLQCRVEQPDAFKAFPSEAPGRSRTDPVLPTQLMQN